MCFKHVEEACTDLGDVALQRLDLGLANDAAAEAATTVETKKDVGGVGVVAAEGHVGGVGVACVDVRFRTL